MRNLHRDLSYELAEYAIAPAVASDPAKIAALTAFMNPENYIAPEPSATAVITGRYQSQITSNSNYVFNKQKDRRIVVAFEQKGAEITGMSADVNLKITGTITGNKIKFFTWPSDITANELKGEWKISADGRRLAGKWGYSAGGGDWNLTKIE